MLILTVPEPILITLGSGMLECEAVARVDNKYSNREQYEASASVYNLGGI